MTPFSETPTWHFTIQLCSQIHILGCIPEMCVRHEALSVSPSHNTSGLKRSLTDQGEGEGAQEREKAEQQKKYERRKTNQVGKWQGLYHTAGMFFICDTAAMSGTKKDKDVQIQSHKEESRGSSWEGSWSETRRLSHPRCFRQQGLKITATSAAWQLM